MFWIAHKGLLWHGSGGFARGVHSKITISPTSSTVNEWAVAHGHAQPSPGHFCVCFSVIAHIPLFIFSLSKKLRNSLATSRGLLPLRASLRQPGRPRVLLTSFSRGGGPAQPTLCPAQKKFWRSGRREPRQLSTDVDRFDGFDGSLDGPMGDGRPPQTPPPGLEPASTRSNQALRTALQAGLQN